MLADKVIQHNILFNTTVAKGTIISLDIRIALMVYVSLTKILRCLIR